MKDAADLCDYLKTLDNTDVMPAMFVGHGSPMNAIENNNYTINWQKIGESLPTPVAILCISAHWLTHGNTQVLTTTKPKTIHDFGGFPQELFAQQYPCVGSPNWAQEVIDLCKTTPVLANEERGIDHGVWSVLLPMFPKADIPVFQLSIDYDQPPMFHYELAKKIKSLRKKGVLIIGSGNIVHNLHEASFSTQAKPFDWAIEFDEKIKSYIDVGDHQSIIRFEDLGSLAQKAHPTYDHYLPLIYSLGVADIQDRIDYFNDQIDLSAISMRSIIFS